MLHAIRHPHFPSHPLHPSLSITDTFRLPPRLAGVSTGPNKILNRRQDDDVLKEGRLLKSNSHRLAPTISELSAEHVMLFLGTCITCLMFNSIQITRYPYAHR